MTVLSDYASGTISLTNGEIEFTGTGTSWLLAQFKEGDTIIDITGATEYMGVIASIDANGAGTLTKPWEGPTLTDVAYRMRYQPDGARSSAQARNLIELMGNGNLQAFAGLSGSANKFPMFTGPGAMTLVPKTDLVSGAAYNVQVANLAARAAYNGQAEGYAVLVADTGDGRSAIYSKVSNANGDWSAPAYVTGPAITLDITEVDDVPYGTDPDVTLTPRAGGYDLAFKIPRGMLIEPGTVTTLPPGEEAEVEFVAITGGYRLDISIPAGEGFSAEGDYASGTTYAKGDVVQNLGSSWIAKQATTGNAPPTLPTTSNAHWQLLARAGNDGAGTVTELVGGDGIGVDNTDPTRPVISVTGSDDLMITASVVAMQVADNANAAIFGPNWVADSFDTLTFVDVAGATSLDTSAIGVLKPTSSTVVINTPNAAAGGAGYTLIDRTTAVPVGTVIKSIGVYSAVAQTVTVKLYRRLTSTTGDVVVDQSFSHPGGGWADCVLSSPYTVPSGSYFLGAHSSTNIDIVSGAIRTFKLANISGSGVTGMDEAGSGAFGMRYTRVTPNMTVRSAAFTALSTPSKVQAMLRVREIDTAAAGTDYTLECSRDNGTTWASMTLTELYTSPSPTSGVRVVQAAETDVSTQPSGTALRWRFKTLNNKMVELHDIYLHWN